MITTAIILLVLGFLLYGVAFLLTGSSVGLPTTGAKASLITALRWVGHVSIGLGVIALIIGIVLILV